MEDEARKERKRIAKSGKNEEKKQSKNSQRNSAYGEWLVKTLTKFSKAWWLPLVLFTVSCLNSLTGGMLIWCFGLTQGMIYTVIVLSRGWLGVLLGPATLTCGSAVTAFTYMTILKQGGAEVLLETTGARDNKWFLSAHTYAEDYGALGLFILQVIPVPIPSAVIVTAGVLADIEEFKIYAVVVGSKFLQLMLGACGMRLGLLSKGQDLEGTLREHFGLRGNSPTTINPTEEVDAKKKD